MENITSFSLPTQQASVFLSSHGYLPTSNEEEIRHAFLLAIQKYFSKEIDALLLSAIADKIYWIDSIQNGSLDKYQDPDLVVLLHDSSELAFYLNQLQTKTGDLQFMKETVQQTERSLAAYLQKNEIAHARTNSPKSSIKLS